MSPDAASFFSRIRHNWFLFVLSAAALILLACLAVAVIGDGPDHGRNYPVPGGEKNASFADGWLDGTGDRLPTIDAYYQATGAMREQLTPDDILARALESGGFTYNPLYGATPQRGYAVSLCGHGKICDPDAMTGDALREYLRENVAQMRDPACYMGGWIDDGRLYLDVSVVLQNGKDARKTGRVNDQAAIFDLGTGETVYLKGPDGGWLVDPDGNWLSGTGDRYPGAAEAAA